MAHASAPRVEFMLTQFFGLRVNGRMHVPQIIVHGDIPVGQKAPEIIFLIKTVLQCLIGVTFGRNLLNGLQSNRQL